MNSERHSTPLLIRAVCALLAVFGLWSQAPLYAAKGKFEPVPKPRWNDSSTLQPDPLPLGDSTYFAGHSDPKAGDTLFWHALDIEGNYLFTATGQGMQVIDLSTPASPNVLSYLYGWISGGAFPVWNYSDKDWFIKQIDAPEGDPSVVVLGMEEQGFAIVRNANTAGATVAYQREEATSRVYAFASGSNRYAYGTSFGNGAIFLYNLNAPAIANLTKCYEHPPLTTCGSIYMGQVSAFGTGWSSMAGTGTFVATGKSGRTGGMTIWNVSTPNSPVQVASVAGGTSGVTIWKSGGSYFAAKIESTGKQLSVYNVSCITSGSCGALTPVWNGTMGDTVMQHVTASVDGANAYLYVGGEDLGSCAIQREFLYDVTTPSNPVEITPKDHPELGGYWGWYYMGCDTGFNLVGPRIGKVRSNRFYRAAMSILDSHKINKGGPPTANFSWAETEIYPGTPVHFQDQSSGGPAAWMWQFTGGSPATSTDSNPTVTFDSPGAKAVTLSVRNAQSEQSAPANQSVTVLDPTPTLGSVTVSPANPTVCQPVTLTAANGKGAPTLSYDFAVLDGGGSPVASNSGAAKTFVWNTGATTQAGNYTARLTLSNGAGSVTKSTAFTLAGLTPLPAPGQFLPTNDAFVAGTVQFHVNAPGATAWNWDFDGDGVFSEADWTSDPVNGPNPKHTYTSKGVRQVRVKVKNCVTTEVLSAALSIEITQITPLKAQFAFNTACSGGVCFGDTTTAVPVLDASTGAELWDYDWNGDGTYEDAGNTSPRTSHLFTATGTFHPALRVRRGAEQDVYPAAAGSVTIIISQGGGGGNNNPAISIGGPGSGGLNSALSFTASGTNCTPSATWNWSAAGATITGGTAASVTISWPTAGNKTVTVTNSGCSGVTGSKSVTITGGTDPGPGGGNTLKADWTFSPAAPAANQAVTFNGSASTGSPTGYTWDFGDGTGFGTGAQVNHTYAAAGTYRVQLTVTKAGSSCPPAPFCENSLVKTVVVGTGEAPLLPGFNTSATCINEGGLNVCTAKPNQTVTFTDASQGGATSWSWNFGDGATATGQSVTHAFKAGSYNVVLTVGRGAATASLTRTFNIVGSGDPEPPKSNTIVLPWIAQSRGTLEQSSDLYVHNPGTIPMEIVLEFRKRGLPEVNPPKATRTIQPGATLYVADVLKELFNWENIVGFVTVTRTKGDADPVMTSFNTTFKDGSQFGQTVPGFALSQEAAAPATTGTRVQYLVGLNDNGEREAYFGLTNPNGGPATYKLKFFDALGRPIGTPSAEFKLSSFGLKQFQPAEIRSLFGINTQDDYRVEVETVSGGQIYPYGANVRTASDDPSFLGVGLSSTSKLYLVGALSTPGLNNSLWQTDIVLANTGTQVALTDVTFTKAGLNGPTAPLKVTLQPGETQRLENLVASQWNIKDSVGVVTLASDSPNGVFPIVQGESYNNANPNMRFGQFMAAFTDNDAAGAGEAQYLVGLRQDANNRTTYWLFNPSGQQGQYDIIYRALDGSELGRVSGVLLGAGKLRQFSPSQHPLPATGVPGGGFTVQVKVKVGQALLAGQVVNNKTNDPAYVQGQAQ